MIFYIFWPLNPFFCAREHFMKMPHPSANMLYGATEQKGLEFLGLHVRPSSLSPAALCSLQACATFSVFPIHMYLHFHT